MTTAVAGRASQTAALMVRALVQPPAMTSQAAAFVVYAPPQAKLTRTSQAAALVPYSIEEATVPRTSQLAALIVYNVTTPTESRTRAWTFTLDGHTFYVLDLGDEGTLCFDGITQQWCRFITNGYTGWNMRNGTQWQQDRVVAGDTLNGIVWELDPDAVLDDGWRDIDHTVTAIITLRTRTGFSCDALRVQASVGQLDEVNGTTMTLNFSDDQGKTWSRDYVIDLTEGTFDSELAWRSLGSMSAPGRVFQLTDVGGTIRIDGADVFLNGFDSDNSQAGDNNASDGTTG